MATSSNSWLQTILHNQHNSQQQSSSHPLYHPSDLPLHTGASHLSQSDHADLGNSEQGMDPYLPLHHSMHSSLQMSGGIQQPSQPLNGLPGNGGRAAGSSENGDPASVRKVHKADREKLRRDRLNEQFGELAGVLDPDRPKNDKATILGDGVQVVKELRAEVKRLKCEQSSLLDESRDLAQEKTELREEKAALKTETEQLQSQLQQRLRGMLPWMAMDPSVAMMSPAPYPYPMPVPQPVSATAASTPPPSEPPTPPPPQQPLAAPSPYLSIAPPGVYMHPYTMYGTRHPDGGPPFMPYPHYPAAVGTHSHVERPYAQYPSPVQAMPGYLVQMQAPQGGANGPAVPLYRPPAFAVSGMALVPPGQQRGPSHAGYPQYSGPGYGAQEPADPTVSSPEPQGVETSLQLQTPGGPSPSPPVSQPRNAQANGETSKAEGAGLDSRSSCLTRGSDGTQAERLNGPGDSLSTLSLSSSSLSQAEAPSSSTGGTRASGEGHHFKQATHDPTLRPPAA